MKKPAKRKPRKPAIHARQREAEVCTDLLAGLGAKEIAKKQGIQPRAVYAIANRPHVKKFLEEKQAEVQARMLNAFDAREAEVTQAMLNTAADSTNKNQAQAFKALTDAVGITAKNQTNIHIGDNNVQIAQIDSSELRKPYDPEREKRLRDDLGFDE